MAGDTAKAKAAYQDFLTLWKAADPDIPILKEAKAESAKLQQRTSTTATGTITLFRCTAPCWDFRSILPSVCGINNAFGSLRCHPWPRKVYALSRRIASCVYLAWSALICGVCSPIFPE